MPKLKSHKGLTKRIKVTASGKVKFKKAFSGHLMSHKNGKKCRHLQLKSLATSADISRLSAMLHRPLKRGDAVKAAPVAAEAVAAE
jgi:large subunit ribosomal protein L35